MPTRAGLVAAFLAALATTFVLTPLIGRAAVRRGIVVAPDERRVHAVPTPQLGGIAMFAGLVVALVVAWASGGWGAVFASPRLPLGAALGAAVIWLVGTIDDLWEVSAPAKTAGIVLGGSVFYMLGVNMFFFRIPFAGVLVLSSDWAPLITVLWVFGMCNAVNLIDGLDGLAGGIVAIAAGAFALYGHRLLVAGLLAPDNPSVLLAVIVLGLCLGFLPHNFHPAKIFMGDGGALLLGALMAASTMLVGGQNDQEFSGQTYFFFAPLFIPLIILGVPILDTAFAIVRRATRRSGVATADKDHLHHRLMRLGHGQRRSVVILWLWTGLLSAFVLVPAYTGQGDAIVPILMAAALLALFTLFHPGIRRSGGGTEADPER